MNDQSRIATAVVLGAVAGGILGYLYLTESGQGFRRQLEPHLDDVITEIRRLRGTVEKAKRAAAEGLESLNEVLGETSSATRGRWEAGSRH